ncbi:VOC family protein, partial [Gordonia sp. OPL2]|uniref:VOC family protein n=1 Tax=Gordonia sp. OPL2 TaxID=2486274 RepID=UPI001654DF06
DVEAARNFYAPLFGWSFEEKAVAGGDEPYVIARKGGDYAAGILRGKNGRWVSNIAVADVDATVAKARNLGFFVVEEPRDWGGKGRAATLRDLEGAEFALWQAKEPHTAERNTAGSFCWTELLTNDREGMQ